MLPEDLNIREYNKFDAYNNVKSSIKDGDNKLCKKKKNEK